MRFYRGDTKRFKFQILDASGDIITATPDSLFFTVRKFPDCPKVIFQKGLQNGIVADDEGNYYIDILPEDTANLEAGIYGFDREVTFGDVVVTQVGKLELLADYTRSK